MVKKGRGMEKVRGGKREGWRKEKKGGRRRVGRVKGGSRVEMEGGDGLQLVSGFARGASRKSGDQAWDR